MKDKIIKWLWLLHAMEGKSYKVPKIYKQFTSIDEIYAADFDYLSKYELDDCDRFALTDKDTSDAERTYRYCLSKAIDIITYEDDLFPSELKEINDCPGVLFMHGNAAEALKKPKIAIVGTRNCTSYGEITTKKLSALLSKAGFTIVTGIADGIDNAAITGAVNVGGSILMFIPCGHSNIRHDVTYRLKSALKNGAFISEHLPHINTKKYSYHERNRLISGISLGTVVTQAPESSGALITATKALSQNRDVFAVLANIDMEQSKGSNMLIRDGAIPVIDQTDIINYYKPQLGDAITDDFKLGETEMFSPMDDNIIQKLLHFKKTLNETLNDAEKTVFACIDVSETSIDAIIENSELPASVVMVALSSLEAGGIITSCPGNKFKIKI